MSEISEGNKFSMAIGSGTYTTGFYDRQEQVYGKKTTDPVTQPQTWVENTRLKSA
jgi:hypothetical protein